jgi:hypothetical protein
MAGLAFCLGTLALYGRHSLLAVVTWLLTSQQFASMCPMPAAQE